MQSQIAIIINIKFYNGEGTTIGAGNDAHQIGGEFGSRSEGVTVAMGDSRGLKLELGAKGSEGGYESTSRNFAKGIK